MPPRPDLRSLRLRLLALVLLALLPAVFLMVFSARERREMDAHKVQQEALRLVLFAATNLERDVEGAKAFLSAMTQDLRWPRGGAQLCMEDLRLLKERTGLYSSLGFADTAGQILCRSETSQNHNLAETPWFKEALQRRGFSVGYDADRILSPKVTMDFALPHRLPGGATVVLFCALDLDWLNRLAQRAQLPENSTLTVMGSQDQVLVRYPDPEKWVGNRLQVDPLAASISLRKEGVAEAPGLDGVRRLYAYTQIPAGGLSLRLGIPTASAYAAANRAMRNNLFGLGVAAVVALLAAWAAGHWMVVRPVSKLVAAARRLGTGNMAARTDMNYHDGELGQLARAFDEMAESLEWREAQLRESEQERLQSEVRFTEMVELATDAIIGVDAKFTIFFFNRGAQRIFGYLPEEVEGKDIRILEPGSDHPRNGHSGLAAALRNPDNDRMEIPVRSKDGSVFAAEATFSRASRNGAPSYTLILREKKESPVPPEVPA